MKLRHAIFCALTLGITNLPSAFACEWHGGGGFGYGSDSYNQDWLAYYEDKQANETQGDRQYSTMSDLIDETPQDTEQATVLKRSTQPQTRPSFSSSAIRASNTAKARLTQNEATASDTQRISTASR